MSNWETIAALERTRGPLLGTSRHVLPITLERLIPRYNNDLIIAGFMAAAWVKRSGSVLHALSDAQVVSIAALIRANTSKLVTVPILAAWICGESLFDPAALNPNNQDAGINDTPEDVFLRTDFGLAQVDGRYMSGHHQMAGLTQAQMASQALTASWAAVDIGEQAAELLDWSANLPAKVCGAFNGNRDVIGFNAYNAGEAGTLDMIAKGEALPYGTNLQNRAQSFAALLGP
jgi:hypothetical protein